MLHFISLFISRREKRTLCTRARISVHPTTTNSRRKCDCKMNGRYSRGKLVIVTALRVDELSSDYADYRPASSWYSENPGAVTQLPKTGSV